MEINEHNSSMTIDFYSKRVQRKGSNLNEELAAKVGWTSYDIQLIGFSHAATFENIDWGKINNVLDIGCGYGILNHFLRTKTQFAGHYTGIDIMPEYIRHARTMESKYDGKTTFIEGDFFKVNWDSSLFDIVISLGIIGVNYDYPMPCGNKSLEHAKVAIKKMASIARYGMSFYFLNKENIHPSKMVKDIAYHNTSDIENIIKTEIYRKAKKHNIICYPNNNDVKSIAHVYFI